MWRRKQGAPLALLLLLTGFSAQAQDDSLLLPQRQYRSSAFQATRIVNAHTVKQIGHGVLDFRINHRFGMVNQGIEDFFGLDNATTRIGFDYGITDWLMVSVGRSSFQKEYDGFAKVQILRQTESNAMPVSLSYVGSIGCFTSKVAVPDWATYYFSNRLSYANMLLVARKFSDRLSLQLMPTHLHLNLVPTVAEKNDLFILGIGGRFKVSRRVALTGEYFYTPDPFKPIGARNALSVGVDVETGGHVFQLHFTNAPGMTDRAYLSQTTGRWTKGDIRFGFNISRVFTIVAPKGW